MSVHFKFVLDKRRKKPDQIYPLKLRLYDNNKSKEKSLGIYICENDWDDDKQAILHSDPNFKTNNSKLLSAQKKVERKIMLAEDDDLDITPDDVVASLTKVTAPKTHYTFRGFANELIANMKKAGKAGNAMAYQDAVNSLINYTGKDALKFDDITYQLLVKYNTAMLSGNKEKGVRSLKINSIAAYMRSIRAIYNKAIKAEVILPNHYPFSKFTIETEDTISRALTLAELKQIFECKLEPGTPIWHNRNYFALSFCLIGMNFADLLTLEPSDIQEQRVAYRRNKTGRIYNIGIHPIVQMLLQYYKTLQSKNGNSFVLPTLTRAIDSLHERKNIKQVCKICNKFLKKIAKMCAISKPITTYYARYTWANLAKKNYDYSNDLIADALGHQYGNHVTGIYLDNYSNAVIDKANARIIDDVFAATSFTDITLFTNKLQS